jgi:hypothetical protein
MSLNEWDKWDESVTFKEEEKPKKQKLKIFQEFKKLLKDDYPSEEIIEKLPMFVMLRWLSNHPSTVVPANITNVMYQGMGKDVNKLTYRFLDDYFKLTGIKSRLRSIDYNKSEFKENDVIKNISKYYKVNYQTAEGYYKLMPEQEKEKFKNIYKEGRV